MVMRTHGYHWFDLARMADDPHASPIRRAPLLYNIFDTRTEGLATGWEEMMLQAGMFDARPRSRELIYVLLAAARGPRASATCRMHANQFTLEQAAEFAVGQHAARMAAPRRRTSCAASSTCTCSSRRTARATSSARCRSSS